jgi:hypothetical protein
MATDILFPFYEVLVDSIFGSMGIAIMGIALALLLLLVISRSSMIFTIYWMIFYFAVMGTLYLGAFGMVFAFILVTIYALTAFIRLTFRLG